MMTRLRRHDENGAVAVVTALMMMLFMIVSAIAIDSSRLYEERRQLQTTADAAALAGAQQLPEGDAMAEATAAAYAGANPTTYHPGAFDPVAGDTVDATTCDVDGVAYSCVKAHMASPDVELFFARVFGFNTARVGANASAVIGNAAIGGDKLLPWVVRDCPDAYNEGRGFPDENTQAVRDEMVRIRMQCPYRFSDNYTSGQSTLFLDDGNGGNFQGADLTNEGDCPATPSGHFPKGGGSAEYRAFLSGNPDDDTWACAVGPGARLHAKSGAIPGPTQQGLTARGVNTCTNFPAFSAAIDVGVVDDGIVRIKEFNPCIIAILMVVKTDPNHPVIAAKADVPGDIRAMQHPLVVDGNPATNDRLDMWRFGVLSKGTTEPVIVRRLAFFYLTDAPSGGPYKGLFLRAIDSEDAVLSGPYDPAAGIYIVKLVS